MAAELVALDTSVIVAAMLPTHEHHAFAAPFVGRLRASKRAVLPLPALVESYSVLTRIPLPMRLEPAAVARALAANFEGRATLVTLEGAGAWSLLSAAAALPAAGGAVYDLHIARCALAGGARRLATFNLRDFARFELAGLELFAPAG